MRASTIGMALIGAGLLASAFSPLLVALALLVQPLPGLGWNILLAAVLALPTVLLGLVLRAASTLPPERVTARTATPRDIDTIGLVASYLAPIAIALFAPDAPRLVAMAIMLVLLMVVYVGAELFYLNPLLACCGFRLYQVIDDQTGVTVAVLTRRRGLGAGGVVDGQLIAPNTYIELGSKR
jgi:MFS family permease